MTRAQFCANRSERETAVNQNRKGIEVKTTKRIAIKNHIHLLLFAAVLGVLASGCTTYQQMNKKVVLYWRQGNLTKAVVEATKMADANAKNKNAIICRLEQGAVMRANSQYDDSNKAFDTAQDKIDAYSQKAKVRLGQEAGALLSNQANLDYEGRAYDAIMLNTYSALNNLAMGEPDKARPELIRAYQRQQDAVEENKRRIEAAQAQAKAAAATPRSASKKKGASTIKSKPDTSATVTTNTDLSTNITAVTTNTNSSVAIEKAQKDPKFQTAINTNYTYLDNLKPYANYVNPFTVYLDGLFFMANAADASDLERAHKSLERVVGFDPDNNYVKDDLATVDALIQGKPLAPTTYVIFETGCAPVRDQIRIDIPIIVTKVSYVGAAFPTLKPQDNYFPSLTVTANGTNATTALVADMDSVIGLDFKNELPIIITKTIASTVTKAVIAYAGSEAAKQGGGDLGQLIFNVGNVLYNVTVNIADERTWTTLPKQFQACHIPTPPDRKIVLETPNGIQKIPVTIEDGTINIIYVKSINPGTPLLVTQMKLK